MRVAFLLHELGRAGGMGVITGHARRLGADIVLTRGEATAVDGLSVKTLDEARGERYDVVLATWWETAAALWELDAGVRAVFLQSLEERFYPERDLSARYGAASVLGLPVHFVTIGSWLRDVVAELRPDALCPVVRNGIDKSVFQAPMARPPGDGRLRVLVEGQPTLWFKGVPEAISAARAVPEPVAITLVAPEPDGSDHGADRVVGGLDPAGMAALYLEHDVLLKLSRVEGVALAPIEAMHVGLPLVTTPVTGSEEYVNHGENALVVGFDDPAGTTAALSALARDPALWSRLSAGAQGRAVAWPSAEKSSATLSAALEELIAAPPLDPAPALRLGAARQRLALELGRAQENLLAWTQNAVEHHIALAQQQRSEIAALDARIVAGQRQLDAVKDERAYRAAVKARNLVHKVKKQ